jgi:alpha-N-arabinofuranosidase
MAHPLFFEQFYKQVEEIIRKEVPNHNIGLAINEWGLSLPESRQYSIEAALYGARLMNIFERSSPLVTMSAESDLINGWVGGIIQAGRHGLFLSPLYHLNQMYNTHLGSKRLNIKVQSPLFNSEREGSNIPYLDAVVSISANEEKIYLKLINTSSDKDMDVETELKNLKVEAEAEIITLSAENLNANNSFKTPDAICPVTRKIKSGEKFNFVLPKLSISVITLNIKK